MRSLPEEKVRIRNCEEKDLSQIREIEKDSFGRDAYSLDLFLELLERFPPGFRVAEMDESGLVGYCIISPWPRNTLSLFSRFRKKTGTSENSGSSSMLLYSLAVRKGHRRQKIGTKLLEDAISTAKKKDPPTRRLVLQVSVENSGAKSLYEKFGFRSEALLRNYYGIGRDAIQMELSLTGQ